jgi:hypothetical protein
MFPVTDVTHAAMVMSYYDQSQDQLEQPQLGEFGLGSSAIMTHPHMICVEGNQALVAIGTKGVQGGNSVKYHKHVMLAT